jgi:hypothetical protein
MNDEQDNSAFERRARELLRDSVDNLDAAKRSRLTQARHAALAARTARPSTRPAWLHARVLAPGGAVAAVALVAVLLWSGPSHHPVNESGSALDDLELLADSDGYELSQEPDLDFIEWAASKGETDPVGT